MTPQERRVYRAQGMSIEMINKLGMMERAEDQKHWREAKYARDNNVIEVSWEMITEEALSDSDYDSITISEYYRMTPEDIYISKESLREKRERLVAALNKLDRTDKEFITILFFRMNGNVLDYSRQFKECRETVRDRKNRILKALRKNF